MRHGTISGLLALALAAGLSGCIAGDGSTSVNGMRISSGAYEDSSAEGGQDADAEIVSHQDEHRSRGMRVDRHIPPDSLEDAPERDVVRMPADTTERSTTRRWPTRSSNSEVNCTAMAYPTGRAQTSVIGIEKCFPTHARIGQAFDYDIIVTNLTDLDLESVTVSDEAEPNIEILGGSPDPSMSGGVATWNLGDMAARESRTIHVDAEATEEGTVGTCASVTYNSLLCTTVPVVAPELKLVKTGPARVLRCENILYTYTVTNTGSGSVNGVTLRDELPSGLRTVDGQNTVTYDVGTLAAGQSKEFSVAVRAERGGEFGSGARSMGDGLEASASEVETLVVEPELSVNVECIDSQYINRQLEYTVTVENTGDGEAREATLEASLPAGAEFVSASGAGTLAGGKVTWDLGTLGPDADREFTFIARPSSARTYSTTVTANAFCAMSASDSCETEVSGIPAILLEVIDESDPVLVGDQTVYLIRVTNQGSAPGTNIVIDAEVEDDQRIVSQSGPTDARVEGRTVRFEPLQSLAAGASQVYRITVEALEPGDTRFTVVLNSEQFERPVQETEATNQYE